MASFVTNEGAEEIAKGTIVWGTGTYKARLVSSADTPTKDDTSMSANYTAIGTDQTLTTLSIVKDTTNDRVLFKADNPTWTSVAGGSTVGWCVAYKDGGGGDATHIPIFVHDVANTATNGGNITIDWPTVGSDDNVVGYLQQ